MNLRDDFQGIRSVDFVAGTAPFYRRQLFDTVGLLNEHFYMYHEDVEFCLRVKAETDFRLCMFPEKLVKHYISVSNTESSTVAFYRHRNLILILKKYSPRSIPLALIGYLREILNLTTLSMVKLSYRYFSLALQIIKGTVDGLVNCEIK